MRWGVRNRFFLSFVVVMSSFDWIKGEEEYKPSLKPASDAAQKALVRMRVPAGFRATVFASEPLLANPVAFTFDEKGRVFVAETFRHHAGVTDTRQHMYWLDDDLACRTVADRVAMYKKHLKEKFGSYGTEHDRVRLLEDKDGDGIIDSAKVFADGFKEIPDGIGAGLLARRNQVYFSCIPDLWLLRDSNNDGKADKKVSLQTGYGVHVGFLGHDLHGLILGPDGRLYFSIGDRGLHVATKEKTISLPDMGAVLRCELDGSGLELFHVGLRNPQELAFDEFGNLFTVDNNSDGGDKARVVHLVEGGDSGWRIGYQFVTSPNARGPWNSDKLWEPRFPGQPTYHLAPLLNLSDGPSGLAYDPGTGMTDAFRKTFYLCDFRGASGVSGVRTFTLRSQGASFRVDKNEKLLWSVLATDLALGWDGALYISDWIEGWDKPMAGRIFKLAPEKPDPRSTEVRELMASGIEKLSTEKLKLLLSHPDQRIRQEAQFSLAERGAEGATVFREVAANGSDLIARVHAVWGLGMLTRKGTDESKELLKLGQDPEQEIRAQVAKVFGDAPMPGAIPMLLEDLNDRSPRVRFFAALALSKQKNKAVVSAIIKLLHENNDTDEYLRHACVLALAGQGDEQALAELAQDSNKSVRLGALLALRRLESPLIASFLADDALRGEAARAIYDVPIPGAMVKLADLDIKASDEMGTQRRVLNARNRVDSDGRMAKFADLANDSSVASQVRLEAIDILGTWGSPSGRDRVHGLWRPIGVRSADDAKSTFARIVGDLLKDKDIKIREAAVEAAANLQVKEATRPLAQLLADTTQSGRLRSRALEAIERTGASNLDELVRGSLQDKNGDVRASAQKIITKLHPAEAGKILGDVLTTGTLAEKQQAFRMLADLRDSSVDRLFENWLKKLLQGEVPPAIQLDLLEAAAKLKDKEVLTLLDQYKKSLSKDDPLAAYRTTLVGGNRSRGERIFREQGNVACLKCHKVQGQGGEVGPELTGIASKKNREYLLESLVLPDKTIANGFDTVVLATSDGQVHVGIIKEETEKEVTLINADAKRTKIAKADIEERRRGKSAMPEDIVSKLSRSELRDVIEFLAELK